MSLNWIDALDDRTLSSEELQRLESLELRERAFRADQVLVFEDDDSPMLYVVDRGWAAAVRELSDGSVQVLDLFLPGQVIGLREVTSAEAVSSYRALTDLETRVCRKSALQQVIEDCPGIAARMFQVIAREEAWLLERITTLGQRNAAQCIAHLLLELGDRLALADPEIDPNAYALPLNQEQIGSVIGITSVHVSRTLKQLGEDGLLSMNGDRVDIHDRARCAEFSEYDLRRMRLAGHASS